MCDTVVATASATVNGTVIFAKNSDRPVNECQPLHYSPRRSHPAGATVRCQYLEIPQVERTWEVIGSRPFWLWGFEMGVNEWGVAVGNEAVFSKEPPQETGLLGMDLVRLALERGRTAYEAMHVVIDLLERYGQGGSAQYAGVRYYDNSFILADPREAWVLETAGRRWVAQRVQEARAISNVYSIETEWDEASPDLVTHAVEMGWCESAADFNFARAYGDFSAAEYAGRSCRFSRSTSLIGEEAGRVSVKSMKAHLRDHYEGTFFAPRWAPPELLFPSICMHASARWPQETAAGMVVELRRAETPARASIWHCFSSPCASVFHPVYLGGVGLPEYLDRGGERYDAASPWWVHEALQRRADANPALLPVLQSFWRERERRWTALAEAGEARARGLLAVGETQTAVATLREIVEETLTEMAQAAEEAAKALTEAEAGGARVRLLQPEFRAQIDTAAGLR